MGGVILASFFSSLKDFDEKFRFVFTTGVTRIFHLGLFLRSQQYHRYFI